VVAEALQAVAEQARPGQSTTELDKVAAEVLAHHGARSPFVNYHPAWAPRPSPAVLCVSVNDAVVHGIPNGQLLADYVHDSDGWTLRTASGARAAHSEHTVAVTRDSARILTR